MVHRHRKNFKTKHRKPSRGVLVTIDETGTLDPDVQGPYYIAVATVTRDRRKFAEVVENLGLPYEIGFSSDRVRAPEILNDVRELIDAIYVAMIPKINKLPGDETEDAHQKLLKALREMIPYPTEGGMLILVDSKSKVADSMAKSIFWSEAIGDRVSVLVVPSNFFFEIQTNDFIAGAIGRKLNKGDGTYFKILKVQDYHEKQVSKSRRGWRSSSGDHSSSRWNWGRSAYVDHTPILTVVPVCGYLNVPHEGF